MVVNYNELIELLTKRQKEEDRLYLHCEDIADHCCSSCHEDEEIGYNSLLDCENIGEFKDVTTHLCCSAMSQFAILTGEENASIT